MTRSVRPLSSATSLPTSARYCCPGQPEVRNENPELRQRGRAPRCDFRLDSDQQRAIADVLARHQKDVDAAWHAMQPHVRSTMGLAHKEIEGILRPEQAATFRKMIEARHSPGHR